MRLGDELSIDFLGNSVGKKLVTDRRTHLHIEMRGRIYKLFKSLLKTCISSGGLSSDWVQVFFPKLVVTYLIAGLAFAFYISDFPERCFPGRFDYFGHAHQWWHVLVVAALYYWHDAGLSFMKRRLVESCFNDVDNGTYSSLNNTSAFDQRPFFDTD